MINAVAGIIGEGLRSEASVSIMQFMDMAALTCPIRITGDLYISSGLLNKVLSVIMAKKVTAARKSKPVAQKMSFLCAIEL